MKNLKILVFILSTLVLQSSVAQKTKGWGLIAVSDQGVDNNGQSHSSGNKAIVYISALEKNPTLIQYFHDEKLIGYTEKNEYLKYVCEPGKQLFWSKIFPINKNSPRVESFLELDLEANQEYYLDTRTYTSNGKNVVRSFKKDKGNLKHELVLLQNKASINTFQELISRKKPNKYKDKKLRKYNEQLYSQITTSLYEYNQRKPRNTVQKNSISKNTSTSTTETSTSVYSAYTLEQLEAGKNALINSGNIAAADLLQQEIDIRQKEGANTIETMTQSNTTNDDKNLETLELEKQEAINDENYLLASQLKEKIQVKKKQIEIEKEKKNQKYSLEGLIAQKNEAVASENYLLAGELKNKIDLLEKESAIKTDNNPESNRDLSVLTNNNNVDELVSYSNNREESLALFMKQKGSNQSNSISDVRSNYTSSYRTVKISKSENNRNADVVNYSRSSLYTLMLNNKNREHAQAIKDAFGNSPLQEKFNNHNIGPYLIDIQYQEKDQSNLITDYLNRNDIAKEMISKWFNRNEKGEFNTDLVAERGYYDASALDISIAKNSERGIAMLADAGEDLIGNTFVIVNDYKFTNKEEVAKKASGWLNLISNVAAYVPGGSTVSNAATYTSLGVGVIGKGYVIKTTSYLYRLVWDEETASRFYNEYWIDENNFDSNKKRAFENSNAFRLELVGSENAWADIQSTVFTKKSNEELIEIATVKATDKAIAKLQRKFEVFRTKSPLLSGNPITAKIGLKEGVEKGDKFEVLEVVQDENGNRKYKSVGVIKVDKSQIWDNRFMANEENNSPIEYTTFKGAKNKFAPGMLIRQIN